MIAYLGTGLLGSNFVKALLRNGKQVQVWNRTAEKATALEADGAKAFATPAEAVKGANRIHMTLSDDKAVDDILAQASAGFEPGVIIIDHTTTTAEGAAKRTGDWKDKGITYLHAPVFMGPQNALDSSGFMLVSGDANVIAEVQAELEAMTGKLLKFGPDTNRAAGMKLLGNLFLMSLSAGISDMMALAKALDIPHADMTSLFDSWNPGASAPARMKKMLGGEYGNPSWELNMARKDARLMMEEAKRGNKTFTIIPAIATEMDKWIANGHGKDDWSVIAKDNV